MYECHDSYETTWLPANNNTAPQADYCANGKEPWVGVNQNCNRISIAWAVGADQVIHFHEFSFVFFSQKIIIAV